MTKRLISVLLATYLAGSNGETVTEASQAEVKQIYPEIGQAGSALNIKFIEAVKAARTENSSVFNEPGWPMKIARMVAGERSTPAQKELQRKLDAAFPVMTIREMETDLTKFLGKSVTIIGEINVSDYYNFGYSGLSSIAYSFTLEDDSGRGHVYQLRSQGDALRTEILNAKGPVRGEFVIQISEAVRHSEGEGVMAQLMKYSPPRKP